MFVSGCFFCYYSVIFASKSVKKALLCALERALAGVLIEYLITCNRRVIVVIRTFLLEPLALLAPGLSQEVALSKRSHGLGQLFHAVE